MLQILRSCLHKQLMRIIGVNLILGNTVSIMIDPITLFQIVFANHAKMRKENGNIILDQNQQRKPSINTLTHTRIKFFQVDNLHSTL